MGNEEIVGTPLQDKCRACMPEPTGEVSLCTLSHSEPGIALNAVCFG